MKKTMRLILVLAIAGILLSGCSKASTSTNEQQDKTDKYIIVTSFYPIYISAINITRDIPGVEVINMTKAQTGCLHDYQLTPQDLKILESADVFLINGADMEAFMDKVIKQRPNMKIIEASKGLELLKEESGAQNPHVWVSVSGAMAEVENIALELATADEKNAELYKKNASAYIEKLSALKEKMHSSLEKVKTRDIVTFHEAFPYFAKEFDLNIKSVVEREPGEDPSAGELAETIDLIKSSNVKALFAEPQYSSKAAETIARETGAKVYILDPVVTGEFAHDAYINAMEKNLKVLEEALNYE